MVNNMTDDDADDMPFGLEWRSSSRFIIITVGIGAFTDMFLYGLIVPVLPFMLEDRIHIPTSEVQSTLSNLLAMYAAASLVASPIAGVLADRLSASRQLPFLLGLVLLLLSTILLAFGTSVPVLAIARLLQGASGGTIWTIGMALVLETVGPENLGKTLGTMFSLVCVAALFAPVLGGLLYAKTGYTGVFGVGIGLVVIDFILRVLMIEKKVAAQWGASGPSTPSLCQSSDEDYVSAHADHASETTRLLTDGASGDAAADLIYYRLPEPKSRMTRLLPILLVLRDPAILTAFFMGFIQAFLLGAFDATVPIVANLRYGFDSLKSGLLFLPLGGADVLLGPVFGWCVDRWGTKPLGVLGFTYLVPCLALMRLPADDATEIPHGPQIALYASLLGLCGVGLALINCISMVESGNVLEKYWKANNRLFNQAPYAQFYGLNSMLWSAGLTVGPVGAGAMRERIGYGNMNAVLAGICGVAAIAAALFVGGRRGSQCT